MFAPAAAALASGVPLESLGPPADPPVGLPDLGPRVLWTDGFGNLVTNLKSPPRRMRIHNHDITAIATTYSEGRPNEPFVYVGSMGYLEVARARGAGRQAARSEARHEGRADLIRP